MPPNDAPRTIGLEMPRVSQNTRTSASTVATMVQIDDLCDISQVGVGGLVDRVVGAGSSMKHQQGRLFPHEETIRNELCALDVKKQPYPVDEHVHGLVLPVT